MFDRLNATAKVKVTIVMKNTASAGIAENPHLGKERVKVLVASSLGTIIEWYEFFLYAYLSQIIATQFFAGVDETLAYIFALLTFAVGFLIRPIGGLVFGRLGDTVGRKKTFLITLVIMGVSTVLVGMLPSYASIGVMAPILLIALRMIQGLAIGGEYGGALVYVAEHAPNNKRGLFTGVIQITVPLGLLMSVGVITLFQNLLGDQDFKDWGWRIPFLLAGPFLALAIWVRTKMEESPVFLQMKSEGTESRAPLKEAFSQWSNLKIVLVALFGVAGQAVVWQTATLYVMFFMTKTLGLAASDANKYVTALLVCSIFFLIFFAWLSDHIGRKPIIIAGCVLAAVFYFPIFKTLAAAVSPSLVAAQQQSPISLRVQKESCASGIEAFSKTERTSVCDAVKTLLGSRGASFQKTVVSDAQNLSIGEKNIPIPLQFGSGEHSKESVLSAITRQLDAAAYPKKADAAAMDKTTVLSMVLLITLFGAMTFGPIGAQLVEIFPTRIRYSALSMPYNIGNGWFGGLLPSVSFIIPQQTGNIYSGLWYAIAVAGTSAVICLLFMPENRSQPLK